MYITEIVEIYNLKKEKPKTGQEQTSNIFQDGSNIFNKDIKIKNV